MKNISITYTLVLLMIYSSISSAQNDNSSEKENWEFGAEANFYFTDPFFVLPVIQAGKSWLHFEARYSYEELETFSGWAGYKFSGGKDFEYEIIPMAGFIAGRIKGFAPGLRFTLGYSGFELSGESEYVFDSEDKESNFFYSFSDLSYSPADWCYFGLSLQRTRIINTDAEFQPGVMAGGSYKNLGMTIYYFMPEEDDKYFILTTGIEF